MSSNGPTQSIPFKPDPLAERTVSVTAVPAVAFVEHVPACLIVTHGPYLGERFELEDSMTVGRDADAELHLGHISVSRRHCRIWRKRHQFHLADLGATNPTRVNGEPIEEVSLRDGDLITIGEVVLKFLAAGNPENAMVSALVERATRDPLTGVLNRRAFTAALERECNPRSRRAATLVLLDIDYFKKINDKYGHPIGDLVLRRVAECLEDGLRGAEVLARVGGEEFALLLPRTVPEDAAVLVEKLRAAIEALVIDTDAGRVPVTASFGYAGANVGGVEALYQRADHALYAAKQSGRNRAVAAP